MSELTEQNLTRQQAEQEMACLRKIYASVRLLDPKTGELTKVVVLVCILPYSGLGFTTLPWRTSSAVYPMPSLTSAEQLA